MDEVDVGLAYKSETMVCIRVTIAGEDRILLLGVTSDTKEPVMVGHFVERGGEYIFYPTGVGWQGTDIKELLKVLEHFQSGV